MNEELLPAHKCSLQIVHNQHRNYYELINDYISWLPSGSWKSDEARNRSISTDEIWELQWYPDTPVGFKLVLAPTLKELLELAKEIS